MNVAPSASVTGTAPLHEARRLLRARPAIAAILVAAAVSTALPLAPAIALAQSAGELLGTVRDAQGVPLAGAMIEVAGTRAATTSGTDGSFRLQRVPAGRRTIQARRIGFHPAETSLLLPEGRGATFDIVMQRATPILDAVFVQGTAQRTHLRLAGFYGRRDKGLGHFFTREDIDRRAPMRTTDLLRTIPGVRLRMLDAGRSMLFFRGASCPPMVWVDGTPLAAAYFDPDLITPHTIEGIEVYSGPSTVPPQFSESRQMGSCGAIIIWSRAEIPPPRRRSEAQHARMLTDLVERNRIFTADQVDTAATIADSASARPTYPDRLLHEGTAGRVVAEFVVDTLGRVERETLGVVSSSHREFADAVMVALTRAIFRPAIRNGRRVRQLVQQPFSFDPGVVPED